jgi:hypothetical protein
MQFVAIATFPRDDSRTAQEILVRRRNYTYPPEFKNVRSWLDVHGGRAVIFFETGTGESILRYTSDWPELTFDIFPVIPSEKGFEAYVKEPGQ